LIFAFKDERKNKRPCTSRRRGNEKSAAVKAAMERCEAGYSNWDKRLATRVYARPARESG
jgi:hypothetical protein